MDFRRLLSPVIVAFALLAACDTQQPVDGDLARDQYEFAAFCLDAFFIFRDRLPSDFYAFSTPEELYESVNEPYTQYFNHDYAKMLMAQLTTANKGGIGIRIDSVASGYLIKNVFANSPGEKAGLHDRDTIIRVGETSTDGLPWESFIELLQGEIGTDVQLRIKRGNNQMNIIVTRGLYSSPSVFVDSVDSITALILLTGFYQETAIEGGSAAEFSAALDKTAWARYTIIDLRDNGGGYISQCVDIVGDLVPNGTPIITTHERDYDMEKDAPYETDTTYRTSGSGKAAGRTLLLLVNRNTASASEMLVSCLMQQDKVTVIGDTTYGKGRGQVMLWGPDSVIAKVTCMVMLPPDKGGISYDEIGIPPDVVSAPVDAFDIALGIIGASAPAKRRASFAGVRPGRCDVSPYLQRPFAIVDDRSIGD